MEIKYFKDTDTLLVNFNNNIITDTLDVNEDILVERDLNGNLVSITCEHVSQKPDLEELLYQQVGITVHLTGAYNFYLQEIGM